MASQGWNPELKRMGPNLVFSKPRNTPRAIKSIVGDLFSVLLRPSALDPPFPGTLRFLSHSLIADISHPVIFHKHNRGIHQ